jgi:hypothetical protein
MTKKQRRGRKSKRTMRKRVQRVRKMHGGDVLHKLPGDTNYLTYYGKVVDMSGNEISDRNFLEIDEGSWEIINTKLQEHAHETFTGADEIIEVGYGGDNGNGTITVKIPEGASNAPGSSVALHVVTKPLGPMIFDIGGQTYRMKFTVNFGN